MIRGSSAEEQRSARGFSLVLRAPLAAIYGAVGARQRAAASRRARRLRAPVVSVGSLRVGGSGKTPAVAFIASLLRDRGYAPAVLSRGYAREEPTDGVLVVRDAFGILADTERGGDEPLLLSHLLPDCAVLVGADRHLSGVLAESRLGCTVHVLDDGFQHVRLARTVDLLLVSREDLDARVLPAGNLREPAIAARRAHAWLVPEDELKDLSERARATDVSRVFAVTRALGQPVPLESGDPTAFERTHPVLLVSGIAHPARFEADVREAGWTVADHVIFRDHHRFGGADLARIGSHARQLGAGAVLTTMKDAVRLLRWRPLPFAAAMLPLDLRVEPADDFAAWLIDTLRTFAPGASAE